MFEESEPKETVPEPVLFHGTTLGRFNLFREEDGSYKDPSGKPLWLDEENNIPTVLGEHYAKKHDDERIIIGTRLEQHVLN